MRFLVDASMAPVVVRVLREAGHDAVHVGEVLRLNAPDVDILEHAVREERVILAADTDFGELLASRQAAEPSVLLFHRQTGRRPREQAALLLVALLAGAGLLYLVSLESASDWPELAHLRLPTYLAVIVGLLPVVVAVKIVFDFLAVVDHREAFSTATLTIRRRLRLLISLRFAWGVLEIAALLLFTVVALFKRIFRVEMELRHDSELTV